MAGEHQKKLYLVEILVEYITIIQNTTYRNMLSHINQSNHNMPQYVDHNTQYCDTNILVITIPFRNGPHLVLTIIETNIVICVHYK